MTYYADDVKKFHDKFGLDTPPVFKFVEDDLHHFRARFFHEEYNELYEAVNLAEAIDALIDLVYITCGTALVHGIWPKEFNYLAEKLECDMIYQPCSENYDHPAVLSKENLSVLFGMLAIHILEYEHAQEHRNEQLLKKSLAAIYVNCMFAAADMGFNEEMWNKLWDDVQRANMSKERALKASDSKRGSTWDVVKPKGWIPPRTEEIVNSFL